MAFAGSTSGAYSRAVVRMRCCVVFESLPAKQNRIDRCVNLDDGTREKERLV